MLRSLKCKHMIVLVISHVVIIFTGAFVVQTNNATANNELLLLSGYDHTTEDSISFLDDFVVENVLEPPPVVYSDSKAKKIVKRSAAAPTVPQFMVDVYERLAEKRFHIKFDTARSFHSSNLSDTVKVFPSLSTTVDNKGSSNFHRLIFNVSHFPESETALFAQLRIQASYPEEVRSVETKKIETFSLMEDPPVLLASKYFNPSAEFLYSVNVTTTFQRALAVGEKLLQFELSILDSFKDVLRLDSASVEGPQLLVLSKTVAQQRVGEDSVLARMKKSLEEHSLKTPVTNFDDLKNGKKFTDDVLNKSEAAPLPWRRGTRQRRSEDEDEETEEQSNYIVEELGRIRKGKLKRKKNPCRRKPLHVNFAAINYDQWIIAPPSYEAFECTGKCSFPMSAHLAPTKHAIIQTLMHSLEPKQVSRASCVPIKLAPISILYVDDDGTVTYKYDYEDMVVAECGCR